MKKQLFILSLLTLSLSATELMSYKATIDVKALKTNGKSWDISGGAPDIYMKVDGLKLALKKECKNSYRCEHIMFISNKKKFYIEVYDRDLASDDLIGKGECRAGVMCTFGGASVRISQGEVAKIVLADTRGDTKVLKEEMHKELVEVATLLDTQHFIKDDVLHSLVTKIKQLRSYGDDLTTKERDFLQEIVHVLQRKKGNSKELIETLDVLSHSFKIKTV